MKAWRAAEPGAEPTITIRGPVTSPSICVEARSAESGSRFQVTPSTEDRKSTPLNSSHSQISYAVFCLNKKTHSGVVPWDDRNAGVLVRRADKEVCAGEIRERNQLPRPAVSLRLCQQSRRLGQHSRGPF